MKKSLDKSDFLCYNKDTEREREENKMPEDYYDDYLFESAMDELTTYDEGDDPMLECGFDPYAGCYTWDC